MLRIVVNLATATDRLAHMEREFARLGLDFTRLDATRGAELAARGIVNRHFTAGTLGCLASHLAACRMIAASGEPWGVVLEDDMWLADDAAAFLATPDWIPPGVELVKLETYETVTAWETPPVASVSGHGLHRLLAKHLGGGAYVISARLAGLLGAIEPATCPVPIDTLLFNPRHLPDPSITTLQVIPAIAIQEFKKLGADATRLTSSLEPDRRDRRAERYTGLYGRLRALTKPLRHALKQKIRETRQAIALRRWKWTRGAVAFGPRAEG